MGTRNEPDSKEEALSYVLKDIACSLRPFAMLDDKRGFKMQLESIKAQISAYEEETKNDNIQQH